MCTFIESVVGKLGALIPEDEMISFKTTLLECLDEGGSEGLKKIKEELDKFDEKPSEDIVKEIEEMYEEYTMDLTSKYKTEQAAAIAVLVKRMFVNIYLDKSIEEEVGNKMENDTWKILSKLEACHTTPLPQDLAEQLLAYGVDMCKLSKSKAMGNFHRKFVDKIKESTSSEDTK